MNTLELSRALNIKIKGPYKDIKNVFIDSRNPQEHGTFIALKGEKTDGHLYIKDLIDKNISGFVVEKNKVNINPKDKFIIETTDTREFLKEAASFKRKKLKAKVIAVAGSAGKTTTKELIAHVLSFVGKTFKTYQNYNSQIGLPVVLLNTPYDTEFLVLEMGATQKNDILKLTKIASQHIGVISAIGYEHMESFKTIENVIDTNLEVFLSSNIEGAVFPSYIEEKALNILGKKPFFSFNSSLETLITNEGTTVFYDGETIKMPVLSAGIKDSFLGAVGLLKILNINWKDLKEAFESFKGVQGRMYKEVIESFTIIDDSYNANPLSVKNAVNTLEMLKGRKFLFLSDMLEMGELSYKLHKEIGIFLRDKKIDFIFLVGKEVKHTYEVLKDNVNVLYFEDKRDVPKFLKPILKKGDIMLFKGSRATKMEELINLIKNDIIEV